MTTPFGSEYVCYFGQVDSAEYLVDEVVHLVGIFDHFYNALHVEVVDLVEQALERAIVGGNVLVVGRVIRNVVDKADIVTEIFEYRAHKPVENVADKNVVEHIGNFFVPELFDLMVEHLFDSGFAGDKFIEHFVRIDTREFADGFVDLSQREFAVSVVDELFVIELIVSRKV